eukprot:Skav235275  [mRNA]  locus=scaffold874:304286:309052:+ [translate_table: standard]
MGAGHSCPDTCVAGETAPQIIVAEKVVRHEQPEGEDEEARETQEEVTYQKTTGSMIRRSLLLEKKLHTDTEIMRGVPLNRTLRNFGRIWRTSPIDMPEEERAKLWDSSLPVTEFDVFLSHTWHTKGIWKFLSLSLQLTWLRILVCGLGAAVFAEILFFVDLLPALGSPWLVDLQGYQGMAPFSLWAVVAQCTTSVIAFLLAPWMPLKLPTFAFLDVLSIHQVDEDLKERGIYGIGGFLKASKELRILWSPPYLSRLWCIFELAAYRMANPEGKIVLQPLFVHAAIVEWYGGADAFTEYVRGPLQKELVAGQRSGIPMSYCMILVAPFLSVGISVFAGLLKANVPFHVSVSYFLSGVIGLWFCWVAVMVQMVILLCNLLARPLVPSVLSATFSD